MHSKALDDSKALDLGPTKSLALQPLRNTLLLEATREADLLHTCVSNLFVPSSLSITDECKHVVSCSRKTHDEGTRHASIVRVPAAPSTLFPWVSARPI